MAAFIAAQRAAAPYPARGLLPGAGSVAVVVLQMARRDVTAAGSTPPRLAAEVRRLFELHDGKHGSPMITADLRTRGGG